MQPVVHSIIPRLSPAIRPRGTSHRAEQLLGYAESRVYPISPLQTKYVIVLRLGTDRPSGTIIAHWGFLPPWPDQLINWDYEPWDIIPEGDLVAYTGLLKSRLMGVLNDRRVLRRGYPVGGLLCGCSSEPIPESGEGFVYGKLTLVDDVGNEVALRIALSVVHPPTRAGRRFQARESLRRRGDLFSKPDSIENFVQRPSANAWQRKRLGQPVLPKLEVHHSRS